MKKLRYVWCTEDEKYGLVEIFATKKAAEKAVADGDKRYGSYWDSGYGGDIFKRKVKGD